MESLAAYVMMLFFGMIIIGMLTSLLLFEISDNKFILFIVPALSFLLLPTPLAVVYYATHVISFFIYKFVFKA